MKARGQERYVHFRCIVKAGFEAGKGGKPGRCQEGGGAGQGGGRLRNQPLKEVFLSTPGFRATGQDVNSVRLVWVSGPES